MKNIICSARAITPTVLALSANIATALPDKTSCIPEPFRQQEKIASQCPKGPGSVLQFYKNSVVLGWACKVDPYSENPPKIVGYLSNPNTRYKPRPVFETFALPASWSDGSVSPPDVRYPFAVDLANLSEQIPAYLAGAPIQFYLEREEDSEMLATCLGEEKYIPLEIEDENIACIPKPKNNSSLANDNPFSCANYRK